MAVATQRPLDLADALCAGGPHPEHADALMLFGQRMEVRRKAG
jgi:hypothetical protein